MTSEQRRDVTYVCEINAEYAKSLTCKINFIWNAIVPPRIKEMRRLHLAPEHLARIRGD